MMIKNRIKDLFYFLSLCLGEMDTAFSPAGRCFMPPFSPHSSLIVLQPNMFCPRPCQLSSFIADLAPFIPTSKQPCRLSLSHDDYRPAQRPCSRKCSQGQRALMSGVSSAAAIAPSNGLNVRRNEKNGGKRDRV